MEPTALRIRTSFPEPPLGGSTIRQSNNFELLFLDLDGAEPNELRLYCLFMLTVVLFVKDENKAVTLATTKLHDRRASLAVTLRKPEYRALAGAHPGDKSCQQKAKMREVKSVPPVPCVIPSA